MFNILGSLTLSRSRIANTISHIPVMSTKICSKTTVELAGISMPAIAAIIDVNENTIARRRKFLKEETPLEQPLYSNCA